MNSHTSMIQHAARHPDPLVLAQAAATRAAPDAAPAFIAGLDLGMVSDYTAFSILEKTTTRKDGRRVHSYVVRHLQRWLGVAYPDIAEQLRPLLAQLGRPALAVDATGVGVAVVSILKKAKLPVARTVPVTITGGHGVTDSKIPGGYNVPKKELVSVAQSALQSGRLQIVPKLKEAKTLRAELQNFKVKVSLAGSESFEAWREGQHDDLVLSCCLALWFGEHADRRLVVSC
jgi:hypothetical protein